MGSIYLLDNTPEGVLAQTVDIVGCKAVDDAVDAWRSQQVGDAFLDWWAHGNREWVVVTVDLRHGRNEETMIDLRVELLRELKKDLRRISIIPRFLGVANEPQRRSVYLGPPEDGPEKHAAAIGRDLLAWFNTPPHDSLKVRLNQSWRRYQRRKRKERESVAA